MYTIESVPATIDYPRLIRQAIKKNVKVMTGAPLPVIGIRGIHYLAKKIDQLSGSEKDKRLYLGHIVRMQEEIGTGGAGFRFVYASFLQEAAQKLEDEDLAVASKAMTAAGDTWREFALVVVKECKSGQPIRLPVISAKLRQCAEQEKLVWQQLKDWSCR